MGVLLGIFSALCWGTADFIARDTTRRIGTYRTQFYLQSLSLVIVSLALLLSGNFDHLSAITPVIWLWAMGGGVLNVLSSLALYRSFETGVLAVVSPIASSYAAITVILAFLSGEVLTLTRGLGIVAALVGVMLTAAGEPSDGHEHRSPGNEPGKKQFRLPPGVIWAVMAAVGYGFSFWILGARVNPALPGIWPIWMIRLSGSITLLLLTLPLRQGLQPPRGIALRGLLGITALDTLAYIAFTYASTNDQLSVVSVLVSLFSAVTVLLAWLILRERLAWWQWLGVGTIFAGIALVSI